MPTTTLELNSENPLGSDPEMPPQSESVSGRAEIDTSLPFESVKEAATRFGGMGFWKPISNKPSQHSFQHDEEMIDISEMEEQAAQLARDLITKEKETLDVLKELETTKNIVDEVKLKLQKEASEISAALDANLGSTIKNSAAAAAAAVVVEKGSNGSKMNVHQNGFDGLDMCPSSAAGGFMLLELNQAKLNLTRTTNDLADIRATVILYSQKIEKERMSIEKTRQRLSLNTTKKSCLEEELSQTRQKLELAKDAQIRGSCRDPLDITRELQRLNYETEQFKIVGEAARSEVLKAMCEIEQKKYSIKTAAKKIKEAARASEAVALAEFNALSSSVNTPAASHKKSESVTLTFEEYSYLISKAREAGEACKGRVVDEMLQIDEANASKAEILKKVEEATEEVKLSKKALEETMSRMEAANKGKLAVEEALRKWRSEHGQKRRSKSIKFKNSYPSQHRKESRLLDVNGQNLVNGELKPVLRPTLSIGQILSRKLLLTEEYENGGCKWKRALGSARCL